MTFGSFPVLAARWADRIQKVEKVRKMLVFLGFQT